MGIENMGEVATKRDFNSALEHLKDLMVKGGWDASSALGNIHRLAEGEEDQNNIKEDYPGWEQADFAKLYRELNRYGNELWEEKERERVGSEKGELTKRSFDTTLRHFKGLLRDNEYSASQSVNQIKGLADGEDHLDEIKKHYPGWEQDDFKKLYQELAKFQVELRREQVEEDIKTKNSEIEALREELKELAEDLKELEEEFASA